MPIPIPRSDFSLKLTYIPEPSAVALLGLGALLLRFRRKLKRQP